MKHSAHVNKDASCTYRVSDTLDARKQIEKAVLDDLQRALQDLSSKRSVYLVHTKVSTLRHFAGDVVTSAQQALYPRLSFNEPST